MFLKNNMDGHQRKTNTPSLSGYGRQCERCNWSGKLAQRAWYDTRQACCKHKHKGSKKGSRYSSRKATG